MYQVRCQPGGVNPPRTHVDVESVQVTVDWELEFLVGLAVREMSRYRSQNKLSSIGSKLLVPI